MEMTNSNCNKFFAKLLLLVTVGAGTAGYSDESVFTNNNSITNKLLSVEKFVNNGKFYIKLDDGTEYNFFNLRKFVNSGLFEFNQNLIIEETVPVEGGSLNPVVQSLASFENRVGGRMVADRTENDFGYVAIVAKDIKNQGTIVATNSNSILLKGDNVDLSRGILNIKSGRDYEAGRNSVGEPRYIGALTGYMGKRIGGGVIMDWGLQDVYWGVGSFAMSGGSGVYAQGTDLGVAIQTPRIDATELVTPKNLIYNNYDLYEEPMQLRYPVGFYGQYIDWSIVGASGFSRRIDRQGDVFKPQVHFQRLFFGDGDNPEEHWYGQGIFVLNRNKSVTVTPRVSPSDGRYGGPAMGPFYSSVLEIKTSVTNKVEEVNETSTIYTIAELGNIYAAATLLTNMQTTIARTTWIPSSFVVSRNINNEFDKALSVNSSIEAYPFSGTFGSGNTANPTVNWATYGFRFTNVLSRVELTTETTIDIEGNVDSFGHKIQQTQPGSVVIEAENLNLEAAKIRAEGNLKIKADNLISSKNAILDCQNISLDIGSTGRLLIIEDLIADEVYRFGGSLELYEATWDDTRVVTRFNDADPPEPEDVTIPLHYKALFVDLHSSMTNQVLVQSLKLRGDDVIIRDKVRLAGELVLQSRSVTFDNDFLIIPDPNKPFKWDATVTPGVISITNNAALSIPGDVAMGSPEQPYDIFENTGTNATQNLSIFADRFNNSGGMFVDGSLKVNSRFISWSDSAMNVFENAQIDGDFFKLRNSTNTVGGMLTMNISNLMVDGGNNSTNWFYIRNGLVSESESNSGKLLNSQFFLNADSYKSVPVVWNSSKDKGPVYEGYVDNRAIGLLSLTNSYLGVFDVAATSEENKAIYVDKLVLEGLTENALLTNKLDQLSINDGMTVYFAASNLPEEKLDGMRDGKLRWVKDYAGHYSSMPLYLPGSAETVMVNRAYRRSRIFDTDGDGIANGFDPTPFGDGRPKMQVKGRFIEWLGLPNKMYRIEYTEKLGSLAQWRKLGSIQNNKMMFDSMRYEIPREIIAPEQGVSTVYIRIATYN
jgi:hypothetical protein